MSEKKEMESIGFRMSSRIDVVTCDFENDISSQPEYSHLTRRMDPWLVRSIENIILLFNPASMNRARLSRLRRHSGLANAGLGNSFSTTKSEAGPDFICFELIVVVPVVVV
jgi:hypothetical protein